MLNKKGFTLMEVLIAASIFAVLASLAAAFFVNISRTERKTDLLNAMYEDSRVIMEIMAREIRNGTVDYEEYYNQHVLRSTQYGVNRGVYASRFYYPGFTIEDGMETLGKNPDNLGVECIAFINGKNQVVGCDQAEAQVYTPSVDQDFGRSPYDGVEGETESAFCNGDDNGGTYYKTDIDQSAGNCASDKPNLNETELYLISSDGRSKTIIGRKTFNSITGDSILAMAEMYGMDEDSNGVVDIFYCKSDYECPGEPGKGTLSISDLRHIGETYIPFVPISPLRSSVKNLEFIIWPDEDPYRSFAEPATQFQPSVTIILTLQPNAEERASYPGTPPEITVETTVSAGAKNRIQTYPPTKDLGWIKTLLNP